QETGGAPEAGRAPDAGHPEPLCPGAFQPNPAAGGGTAATLGGSARTGAAAGAALHGPTALLGDADRQPRADAPGQLQDPQPAGPRPVRRPGRAPEGMDGSGMDPDGPRGAPAASGLTGALAPRRESYLAVMPARGR